MDVIAKISEIEAGRTAKGGNRFDCLLMSGMSGFVCTMFAPAGNFEFFQQAEKIKESGLPHIFDVEVSVYNSACQFQFGRRAIKPLMVEKVDLKTGEVTDTTIMPTTTSSMFANKRAA